MAPEPGPYFSGVPAGRRSGRTIAMRPARGKHRLRVVRYLVRSGTAHDNEMFTFLRDIRDMRHRMILMPFLSMSLLMGCGVPPMEPVGAVVAATMASIPVIQRTPFDAVYSVIAGQDCSVVRWDRGLGYCRPTEPPPAPPPYCSRSLGAVDCWRDPALLANRPRELADGPRQLTAAQEADRTRGWPIF